LYEKASLHLYFFVGDYRFFPQSKPAIKLDMEKLFPTKPAAEQLSIQHKKLSRIAPPKDTLYASHQTAKGFVYYLPVDGMPMLMPDIASQVMPVLVPQEETAKMPGTQNRNKLYFAHPKNTIVPAEPTQNN